MIMEHAAENENLLVMGNFASAEILEENMLGSRFVYRDMELEL